MKKYFLFIFALLVACSSLCQNVLVLHKITSTKKYFYMPGDYIRLKTKTGNLKLNNFIGTIGDSSFQVGNKYNVKLDEVKTITRKIHGVALLSKLLMIAGGGYLLIDSFNRLINNEQVFYPQTLIISGSFIAAGLVLIPVANRQYHIGLKWKLKILDASVLPVRY